MSNQSVRVDATYIALGLQWGDEKLFRALTPVVRAWVDQQVDAQPLLAALDINAGELVPFRVTGRHRLIAELTLAAGSLVTSQPLRVFIGSELALADIGVLEITTKGQTYHETSRPGDRRPSAAYLSGRAVPPRGTPMERLEGEIRPSEHGYTLTLSVPVVVLRNNRRPALEVLDEGAARPVVEAQGSTASESSTARVTFTFAKPADLLRLSNAGLEGRWARLVADRHMGPAAIFRVPQLGTEAQPIAGIVCASLLAPESWLRLSPRACVDLPVQLAGELARQLGYPAVLCTPALLRSGEL